MGWVPTLSPLPISTHKIPVARSNPSQARLTVWRIAHSNPSIYNMQVIASAGERRNTKTMEGEKFFHMKKGVDHTSYAKNSLLQRTISSKAGPIIEESARKVYNTLRPDCLMIAEMGCSSGANSLLLVSRIIDIIDEASRSIKCRCPQFGVFLNDLPGNDFNTLFTFLPNFNKDLEEAKGSGFRPCFVSGIPKSFYGRVFPDKFLHFVHSSYSVHWLSQVPRGLVNENGEALNKGNVFAANTSPREIHKAYYEQFKSDFTLFLSSRSREMISGGGMVVVLIGRINNDNPDSILELVGPTFQDMVLKGVIEQENVDELNVPFYTPTVEEVKKLVEAEESFALDKLETFTVDWSVDTSQNLETQAKFVSKTIRAVVEPLITTAFGHAVMDDWFTMFENRVKEQIASKSAKIFNIVLSVTKKY